MFPYLVLVLGVLAGLALLAVWFARAEPKDVLKTLRWAAIIVVVLLTIFLVFTRRYAALGFLLPLLLMLLIRWRALRQRLKAARGPTPGQTSEILTRFLRMTLDHDSGEMRGEVLMGRFSGRRLDELELEQLVTLWEDCRRDDAQSAAVLEAYLDRTQGEAWREMAGHGAGAAGAAAGGGPMTREEAYNILGLEPGASAEAIREAHRRLMRQVHPDHGGSNYLAAKINEAKDLLLSGAG